MLYQLSYSRSCSVIVRLLFPNKNQKKKRKAQNSNLKNVTVMTDASYASSNPLQCTTSQGMGGQSEPGRTRTCNPRLRRPMPYPLGHGSMGNNLSAFSTVITYSTCCIRSRGRGFKMYSNVWFQEEDIVAMLMQGTTHRPMRPHRPFVPLLGHSIPKPKEIDAHPSASMRVLLVSCRLTEESVLSHLCEWEYQREDLVQRHLSTNAASEDRTHDLGIMRPTRCQLR